MTQNEQLMPEEFVEEWEVFVGDQRVRISGERAKVLKEQMASGSRGHVVFDDMVIAIPFISAMFRLSQKPKYRLEAGEMKTALKPEEISKKIAQLKEKLAEYGVPVL